MAVDDSHQRNNVCLVPVLLGGVKVDDLPPPLRPLTCIELMDDFRNTDDIIQAISSMLFYNHDKCSIIWNSKKEFLKFEFILNSLIFT